LGALLEFSALNAGIVPRRRNALDHELCGREGIIEDAAPRYGLGQPGFGPGGVDLASLRKVVITIFMRTAACLRVGDGAV
jgi:hypothetical protein